MTKYCPKCQNHKEYQEFNSNKSRKDGLSDWCRVCNKVQNRELVLDEKTNKLVYRKSYRIKNKEKIKAKNKEYELRNKDKIREKSRLRIKNNPEKQRERVRKWRLKVGKEKLKQYKIKAKIKNPNIGKEEYLRAKIRNGGKAPKNKRTKSQNEYEKLRIKTNINYRLAKLLRTRLRIALKNNIKNGSAVTDLGCSLNKFKMYLQIKFYRRPKDSKQIMTWENHGVHGWHIDHIKPLASFDLTNREQLLQACHYTNLQPLWAEENYKKRDNNP